MFHFVLQYTRICWFCWFTFGQRSHACVHWCAIAPQITLNKACEQNHQIIHKEFTSNSFIYNMIETYRSYCWSSARVALAAYPLHSTFCWNCVCLMCELLIACVSHTHARIRNVWAWAWSLLMPLNSDAVRPPLCLSRKCVVGERERFVSASAAHTCDTSTASF